MQMQMNGPCCDCCDREDLLTASSLAAGVDGLSWILQFKVLLGLKGIPAHLWNIPAVELILVSSCAKLDEAPKTVARDELAVSCARSKMPQWGSSVSKKTLQLPPAVPAICKGPGASG